MSTVDQIHFEPVQGNSERVTEIEKCGNVFAITTATVVNVIIARRYNAALPNDITRLFVAYTHGVIAV